MGDRAVSTGLNRLSGARPLGGDNVRGTGAPGGRYSAMSIHVLDPVAPPVGVGAVEGARPRRGRMAGPLEAAHLGHADRPDDGEARQWGSGGSALGQGVAPTIAHAQPRPNPGPTGDQAMALRATMRTGDRRPGGGVYARRPSAKLEGIVSRTPSTLTFCPSSLPET